MNPRHRISSCQTEGFKGLPLVFVKYAHLWWFCVDTDTSGPRISTSGIIALLTTIAASFYKQHPSRIFLMCTQLFNRQLIVLSIQRSCVWVTKSWLSPNPGSVLTSFLIELESIISCVNFSLESTHLFGSLLSFPCTHPTKPHPWVCTCAIDCGCRNQHRYTEYFHFNGPLILKWVLDAVQQSRHSYGEHTPFLFPGDYFKFSPFNSLLPVEYSPGLALLLSPGYP